jgi:hypothetical protein
MMTETIGAAIDLRPLFNDELVPLLVTGLTALGGWAIKTIQKQAHIHLTEKQADIAERAMHNAIQFAISRASKAVDSKLIITPKNEMIATAVNYVLPKIPNTLKDLKITPADLAERIEARFADHLEPAGGDTLSAR